MLNYSVLSKNPSHFRNFSGLQTQEFDALNSQLKAKYPAFEAKRLQRNDRKRAVGAGHPFVLSLTDRLLLLLIYYHMYPSSTLLGYLFNVSQTSALKSIKKLEPLVSEVLPLPKKQYEKVRRLQSVEESRQCFLVLRLFWMQLSSRSQDHMANANEKLTTAVKRNGTP
jgi:hypothetical protein